MGSYFVRDVFTVSRDEFRSLFRVCFLLLLCNGVDFNIQSSKSNGTAPNTLTVHYAAIYTKCAHLPPKPNKTVSQTNYHSLLFYKVLNEALTSCCLNTVSLDLFFPSKYTRSLSFFHLFLSLANIINNNNMEGTSAVKVFVFLLFWLARLSP